MTKDKGERRPFPVKATFGITIGGAVALVVLGWQIDDRYLPRAFAGEVQETFKEIRADIQGLRKENELTRLHAELDRWLGRLFDLESRYGMDCSDCPADSQRLARYLDAVQNAERMQQRIESATTE